MDHYPPTLQISKSPSSSVRSLGENSWHLEIPAGNKFSYRIAQLDDHGTHRRSLFHWKPPLTFSLTARVSAEALPGTWGFGMWNDPFNFAISYNLLMPRLPALPNAAWFFYAAPQNYLSIYNDLPANKFLAATFSSTRVPTAVLMLFSPILALTLLPGTAQMIRRLLRRWVKQDAAQVQVCPTDWHVYRFVWDERQVSFYVDDMELKQTSIVPYPPLSLVIWIDNQYAALPPSGGLKFGYSTNSDPAWMEVKEIRVLEHS